MPLNLLRRKWPWILGVICSEAKRPIRKRWGKGVSLVLLAWASPLVPLDECIHLLTWWWSTDRPRAYLLFRVVLLQQMAPPSLLLSKPESWVTLNSSFSLVSISSIINSCWFAFFKCLINPSPSPLPRHYISPSHCPQSLSYQIPPVWLFLLHSSVFFQ